MIFVGDDWSEDHHDIEIQDDHGRRLAKRRLPEGVKGMVELHAMVADHADHPTEVMVGIETDRGLWPAVLVAAGYQVYAVNPRAVARYRERHSASGAKSDAGDAMVLADLVRTDGHKHRMVAGDSELAEAVKALTRTHQRMVWSRYRQVQQLRAALREFHPAALVAFGTDLADRDGDRDASAVLERAPTPVTGRSLSRSSIAAVLRRAGRRRNIDARAAEIQAALRSEQLEPSDTLAGAYGAVVRSTVAVIAEMNRQLNVLEAELADHFDKHPDAEIIRSQPGLGVLVGARVLGEFGDDPNRYADAKARATTPAPHQSRLPPASSESYAPATSGTATSRTRAIGGRSVPWANPLVPVPTTTSSKPAGSNTTPPCEPWPTGSSASSTAAYDTASSTTRRPPGGTAKQPDPSSARRFLEATLPRRFHGSRPATAWSRSQGRPKGPSRRDAKRSGAPFTPDGRLWHKPAAKRTT